VQHAITKGAQLFTEIESLIQGKKANKGNDDDPDIGR
jgi:hypothetical protein